MAHTYYHRLTMIHNDDVALMDPRLGIVIAETATTGRFVLSDVNWQSTVAPNADTLAAYHNYGELKIYESLGMSLFDYIKAAAFQLGVENHLDARYFLEIEIIGETTPTGVGPFRYIFPIFFITTNANGQYNERGTEYILKFCHASHQAQSDLIQPFKDATTIKASTLKEYFDGLQKELEKREFEYAKARQKAGSSSCPGGNNPAANDIFHDEYHFILEPRIEKFKFTSQGKAERGVQETFPSKLRSWIPGVSSDWSISARPGTTIVQQITNVLQSTKEISDLLPGKPQPATKDASGSSNQSAANEESMLAWIYQFIRVETNTVYKAYDYIRGRYACKYVFLVYLADQANMYQFPDEIDQLNLERNKSKVVERLNNYITRNLLRKIYYYNYTGLNTDILRVDINVNQFYNLPSFSQVWVDRGMTGAGKQNKWNDSRETNPFVYEDDTRLKFSTTLLRQQAAQINTQLVLMTDDKGNLKKNVKKDEYNDLQKELKKKNEQIEEREKELAARRREKLNNTNEIKNRADLLTQLQGKYVEDINFQDIRKQLIEIGYPNLRPRMEIDPISESIDIKKSDNEALVEKLFQVQFSSRDLMNMELEIIGDPYWLGVPNIMINGNSSLANIELPAETADEIKAAINTRMTDIDPNWNSKRPAWDYYDSAQWYLGTQLFYFNAQIPNSKTTQDDMLVFDESDQIKGIYIVTQVVNDFKNGRWTQKLTARRDLTIPHWAIPAGVNGNLNFEDYVAGVLNAEQNPDTKLVSNKQAQEAERNKELAQENKSASTNVQNSPAAGNPKVAKALDIQRQLLKDNPAPQVQNPVVRAIELKSNGRTKDQAYSQAKSEYISQVNAYTKHMEDINTKAYSQAGVGDYKPYSAQTMAAMAITRSGSGGLEAWKDKVTNVSGPAITNNPAAIGYDGTTGKYKQFNSFTDGMNGANEYFNYGSGVQTLGKQGTDRLLLPANRTGSQVDFLAGKLKGGGI